MPASPPRRRCGTKTFADCGRSRYVVVMRHATGRIATALRSWSCLAPALVGRRADRRAARHASRRHRALDDPELRKRTVTCGKRSGPPSYPVSTRRAAAPCAGDVWRARTPQRRDDSHVLRRPLHRTSIFPSPRTAPMYSPLAIRYSTRIRRRHLYVATTLGSRGRRQVPVNHR